MYIDDIPALQAAVNDARDDLATKGPTTLVERVTVAVPSPITPANIDAAVVAVIGGVVV